MRRDSKGFTLVELIIVIAVIGVLAAILIPVFSNVIKKANAKSALSDARNAVTAYVTEAMDRRTQGDTSCPELITIIVQKAGRYYLFGYDTAHSNSIMVSNANEDGIEASGLPDLITHNSWNGLHSGTSYDPADPTDYVGVSDGYFYLVQRDGTTGEALGGQTGLRGIVQNGTNYYLRLDEKVGDYGLDLNVGNDTQIYQGCLIKGTCEGVLLSGDSTGSDSTSHASITHTITYDLNLPDGVTARIGSIDGAAFTASYTVNHHAEHVLQGTPFASNTDYTFNGWYEGTEAAPAVLSDVTADHALHAEWTQLQRYSITLSGTAYGTSSAVTYAGTGYAGFTGFVQTGIADGTVVNSILDNITATMTGDDSQHHTTWMIQFEGESEIAYNGTVYLTKNLTATPVFGINTYTFKFIVDGDEVPALQKTVSHGATDVTLPNPGDSVTNGHFRAWKISSTPYDGNYPGPVTSDLTFTADFGWYTVTFYDAGGNALDPQPSHTGDTYNVPNLADITPTTGYHITGWTVANGGANSTCTESTYTAVTNNVSITATEAINVIHVIYTDGYTPGYDAGTAGIVKTSQDVNYNGTPVEPDTNPTWGLNTFDHWSHTGAVQGAHDSTLVIYAVWEGSVTLTLDKNTAADVVYFDNSTFVASNELVKNGTFLLKNLKDYRDGATVYLFNGWLDSENHEQSGTITVSASMTLTADWTQQTYYDITLVNSWSDTSGDHHVDITGIPADFTTDGDGNNLKWTDAPANTVVNSIIDGLTATLNPTIAGMRFEGWEIQFAGSPATAYDSGVNTQLTANLTIRPVFGPIEYQIHFLVDDADVENPVRTKTYGQYVGTFPTDPGDKGPGQHFKGWQLNGSGDPMLSYPNPVTDNMTFRAVFGPYELHIYDIGAVDITPTPTGDTYAIPAENTLNITTGYHFAGWTVSSGAPAVEGNTYTATANNITITATEAINVINVVYTDGYTAGSTAGTAGVITTVPVNYGASVPVGSVPANPTRTGDYTFNRWSEDGTSATITGTHGGIYPIYAIWNDPITITYNANVVSGATVPQTTANADFRSSYTVEYDGTHTLQANLKDYSYNGVLHRFNGWFVGADEVTVEITNVTADTTIQAHWVDVAEVTITLTTAYTDLNSQTQNVTYSAAPGFSGTPLTMTVHEGDNLNTIIDALAISDSSIAEHMHHTGWQIDMGSGYNNYNSGLTYTVGTVNISVKPIIGPVSFTVQFLDYNDSVVKTDDLAWGASVTFPAARPDRGEGLHFKGWQLNGSGDPMLGYAETVAGAMTFRAVYGPYVVKFYNPNGTEITGVAVSEDTYTVPTPTCSANYHFAYWTLSAGANPNTCGNPGTQYTAQTDNISITAHEAIDTHTVTFKDSLTGNTYTTGAAAPQNINHGATATNPGNLSNTTTHNFVRWATAQNGTTAFNFSSAINNDTVVWAVWEEVPSGVSANITFYDTWNEENVNGTPLNVTIATGVPTIESITTAAGESNMPGNGTYTMVLDGAAPNITAAGSYTIRVTRHKADVTGDVGTDYIVVTNYTGFNKISGGFTISGTNVDLPASQPSSLSGNYWLYADIALPQETYCPIGWWESSSVNYAEFSGKFDGNGHTVASDTKMNLDWSGCGIDYVGLFAKVSGTVKNTYLRLYAVGGHQYVGGIAGQVMSGGKIENCAVYCATTIKTDTHYAGGIAGNNAGTIKGCLTNARSVEGVNGTTYLGGIAGYNTGTITESLAASGIERANADSVCIQWARKKVFELANQTTLAGNVSDVKAVTYVGGITGYNTGAVSDCAVTNRQQGIYGSDYVGGIAGYNSGSVTNCWNNLDAETGYFGGGSSSLATMLDNMYTEYQTRGNEMGTIYTYMGSAGNSYTNYSYTYYYGKYNRNYAYINGGGPYNRSTVQSTYNGLASTFTALKNLKNGGTIGNYNHSKVIIGDGSGTASGSYVVYSSGGVSVTGGVTITASDLKAKTSNSGWTQSKWDFGNSSQYPVPSAITVIGVAGYRE